MKNAGVIRRIDDLGRVVVPSGMRKILDINKGDQIEIFLENGLICFKKYYPDNNCKMLVHQAIKSLDEGAGFDNDALIKQKLSEIIRLLGG